MLLNVLNAILYMFDLYFLCILFLGILITFIIVFIYNYGNILDNLFHQHHDTRKITRSLEKNRTKNNCVPSILTTLG